MDLKDYKLVWSDEFDSDTLDSTKWTFEQIMGRGYNSKGELVYDTATDEKVAKVEDGKLKLNVYYDYERKLFVGPVSVCTHQHMSFTYGYVEMRAKVPYSHGAWASLWALSRGAINADKSQPYFAEVDIFETDGACHIAQPNLHKWHYMREGNAPFYFMGPEDSPIRGNDSMLFECWERRPHEATRFGYYHPENPEDFNIYGFLWTPEKMEMYINGDLFGRYDITQDFGRPSGMAPFHGPIFLIMNNFLSVQDYSGMCDNKEANWATPEDVKTQVPYEIDYIRLYQRDGEGELNLA